MKKKYVILQYYEVESELSKEELLKLVASGKLKPKKPVTKVLENP